METRSRVDGGQSGHKPDDSEADGDFATTFNWMQLFEQGSSAPRIGCQDEASMYRQIADRDLDGPTLTLSREWRVAL